MAIKKFLFLIKKKKNFRQRKLHMQMASLVNSTNISRRNNTNSAQLFLEYRKEGNSSQFILQGQHYPNIKTKDI